jgi:heme exporter protein A
LLRALCGLFMPASGNIVWNNVDIQVLGEEYRAQIAYLGHLSSVSDDLTAIENLQFAARMAAIVIAADDAAAALEWFGLRGFLHQPCKTLSQGQRRRVALARLRLAAAKPLWILDEPFTALDNAAVALAQAMLASHLDAGGMAVLTTHQDLTIAARHIRQIELGT